jgi:integrase
VPMPASLVALLRDRRKHAPHTRWIFVNRQGEPEGHFLKKFKRIGLHAGINCGECVTAVNKGRYDRKRPVVVTCKTDPVCEHVFLHRLRKTCASRWEAGCNRRASSFFAFRFRHSSLSVRIPCSRC